MNRTVPLLELHGIEKLREEELEEARSIQAVMLPAESLRTKLERLQDLCRNQRHLSPTEILGRIFSAVQDFSQGCEQHDDMAAALLHYSG